MCTSQEMNQRHSYFQQQEKKHQQTQEQIETVLMCYDQKETNLL